MKVDSTIEIEQDQMSEKELKKFKKLIDKIKQRCEGTKIEIVEAKDFNDDYELIIPCGRDKRSIYISDIEDAEKIVNVNFEKYIFLDQYLAICSYIDGSIEAVLESLNKMPIRIAYRRIFGRSVDSLSEDDLKIEVQDENGIKITLAYPTNECLALISSRNYMAIKIDGVDIKTHDDAVNILEKVSNSFLFQLDLLCNVSLNIARTINRQRLGRPTNKRNNAAFCFPTTQYDLEPISLYWYAKSAIGLPLLQFLAYYQSIEFYFPVYSEIEAKKVMKNIMRNPTFNKNNDADIAKIVQAVKSKLGKGYEAEKIMLRSTLSECIDIEQARNILLDNKDLYEYFSSNKCKVLSEFKINFKNDADFITNIIDRIYDIRCKIVHTKANENQTNLELLLPFSKEVQVLHYDIDLIEYISQQVIIAGGSILSF